MTRKVLATPRTRPNYAESVRLDHVGYHPQRREMSIRLSFGYFEGSEWKETGEKHVVIKDHPAVGIVGDPDYVAPNLEFTSFETSFKAKSFKTTSLESWVLAFATQDEPGTFLEDV